MRPEQLQQQKTILMIVSLALLVVGIFCLYMAYFLYRSGSDFDYSKYTATATGRVVDMKYGESQINQDGHNVTEAAYTPMVMFITAHGDSITFGSKMSAKYSSYYDIGQDIEVMYNPDNPQKAEINEFLPKWGIFITLGGLGAFALLAGLFLLYQFFKMKQQ